RDLLGGDFAAQPVVAAVGPGVVEEALPAVGGGQDDDPAARDGQHGHQRDVDVVGDAGGLVDDDQADVGVAADGGLLAGQRDDAAAVREGQLRLRTALLEVAVEAAVEAGDGVQHFLG